MSTHSVAAARRSLRGWFLFAVGAGAVVLGAALAGRALRTPTAEQAFDPVTWADRVQAFTTIFLGIFIEAVPFVAIGALLSGVIEMAVSTRTLARWVPARTGAGVLAGAALGMVFPVCECGVVLVVRRLLSKGLPPPVAIPDKPLAMLPGHIDDGFGYCTEFVLVPGEREVDVEGLRRHTEGEGYGSVVIVGDEQALRVHVHTNEPERLLEEAGTFGELTRPKFEDMSAQHMRFREEGSGEGLKVGLLALSSSAGFDEVFGSLGASVHRLEAIVKPAAGDIAQAADALGPADVIVLPNHKNAIPAAEQAVELARCNLHVAPSISLGQGAAAAIAFNALSTPEENTEALAEALDATRSVEVTRAAADRTADGVDVQEGEAITLVNGTLIGATDDPVEGLLAGLSEAEAEEAAIVTVYVGEGFEGSRDELAERIEAAFEDVEVEVVEGGQPLYELVAAVEA